MKFYLAGRYERRTELWEYGLDLSQLGHEITSHWLFGDEEQQDAFSENWGRWAELDLADIAAADCVLVFTESSDAAFPRGSRHVELGYALALKKIVVAIGPCENLFVALCVRYDDWPTALKNIGASKKAPAHLIEGKQGLKEVVSD